MQDTDTRAEMMRRLKRIEGQTRGVQKMLEAERDCTDILHQLSAINEAVRSVSLLVAEQYAHECMDAVTSKGTKSRQAIAAMLDAIARVPR